MEIMEQLSIKGLFLPAIALCSLLVVAGPTEASPVTFSFTGTVGQVTGVLPTLGTGNMSGTITINDATTPLAPGVYGITGPVITGLTLNIPNTYTAVWSAGPNGIVITNNTPADSFTAFSTMTGGLINGVRPTSFDWSLNNPFGTPSGTSSFNNTDLVTSLNVLTTAPGLGSFKSNEWRLVFGNENDGSIVKGSFGTLIATPLPAAAILFGVGLIALVGLGAGGLRNLREPQA